MEDQFEDFIKVLEALEKHEVDDILIGGVAVILFRSIEEANRHGEEFESAHAKRVQARMISAGRK